MVDLRQTFPPLRVFEASFNRSLRRVWEEASVLFPLVFCGALRRRLVVESVLDSAYESPLPLPHL